MIAVVALIVSGIIMDYKNSIFFSILNGENRVAFLISFIAYWISIGFEYKQILGLIKSSLELSISLQVTFILSIVNPCDPTFLERYWKNRFHVSRQKKL